MQAQPKQSRRRDRVAAASTPRATCAAPTAGRNAGPAAWGRRLIAAITLLILRLAAAATGRDAPMMARVTYRLEQQANLLSTLGLAVGVGGFCSFFARSGLNAADWMIAAITSAGAVGSMASSLVSGRLHRLNQSTVAGCGRVVGGLSLAAVALLNPAGRLSAWLFTALALITAAAMMATTHAVTQIWKCNYPVQRRGAIVSRIFIVQVAMTAALAWLAGRALDAHPQLFRLLFAAGGACWIAAGLIYRRIPIRGDRRRRSDEGPTRRNPFAPLGVLRSDPAFARYQTLQMIQGMACLGMGPVWTVVLSDRFNFNYSHAATALMTIPMVMQLAMIPFLGGLFDRVSLFRFRWLGSLLWMASLTLLGLAVMFLSVPLVLAAFVAMGMGQSFGRLAWSMGHMDFGDPRENLTYMSAHMMLTGLRGVSMPFVGMWLYQHLLGDAAIWLAAAMLMATALAFRLFDPHAGLKSFNSEAGARN